MTEPTTIEKIDAMLAWLDEGAWWEKMDGWRGSVVTRVVQSYHDYAALDWSDDHEQVVDGVYGTGNARNIAALLNGIRPTLEAARDAYIVSGSIHRDYALDNIIEPLWQAFKEARDA